MLANITANNHGVVPFKLQVFVKTNRHFQCIPEMHAKALKTKGKGFDNISEKYNALSANTLLQHLRYRTYSSVYNGTKAYFPILLFLPFALIIFCPEAVVLDHQYVKNILAVSNPYFQCPV
jgi:hypothetical protein